MKRKNINILLVLALSVAITFAGCSKDDGAIPDNVSIEDVPAMTMNLEPQKKDNIDTIRLASQTAFAGKFKVALVFPDAATKPAKVDIVVRKNASAGGVKLFKADVATFPTSFTITAAEIATLFGVPVALNDNYDFAADIYTSTKKYEAFPAVGAGNGSGVIGMNTIGFFEFVRISVKN